MFLHILGKKKARVVPVRNCNNGTTTNSLSCIIYHDKIEALYEDKADPKFSKLFAKILLKVTSENISSNEIQFPLIADPLNITLNINGIELASNEQIIEPADSNLDITSTNSPEPFYIYMYKNSTQVAFNQTRLLVKNIIIEDNIYTFAIRVCGVHTNVTYSPKFTKKSNNSTERTSVYVPSGHILDFGYIAGLFSLGIIILITIIAIICMKRNKCT
uniref:Uncharacterized protein n=1 Tax=Biomphalaria glabrata TaxID=6526 RepID=A0A2C9M1E1_BIOGL